VTGLGNRLRGPLWESELDLAIARALTDNSARSAYAKLPQRERRCNSFADGA